MSLYIASINSGSNGNCYYVGNEQEAILVDAGISCREIEQRMNRLGLPLKRLKALVISHEHADHIRGVDVFSRKHRIPVLITQATLRKSRLKILPELICSFNNQDEIRLGDLTVKAFSKPHDAADPHSFMVSNQGVNVGVFTDIGGYCPELDHHFGECHAAFLEANYDEEMLDKGPYPYHLKNRIRGGQGHLSNAQALGIFQEHRSEKLSHLILAHLSAHNNRPDLVADLFRPHMNGLEMLVASRHAESPVYHIRDKATFPGKEQSTQFVQSSFSF